MSFLKKAALSFQDKAGNSYSTAKTGYRTVPKRRGRHFTGLPSKDLSWLSSDSRKSLQGHATGILSPKPQFSKIVKTNFNQAQRLDYYSLFFFNVLKLLFLPVSEHSTKVVNGSKRTRVHEDASYRCKQYSLLLLPLQSHRQLWPMVGTAKEGQFPSWNTPWTVLIHRGKHWHCQLPFLTPLTLLLNKN